MKCLIALAAALCAFVAGLASAQPNDMRKVGGVYHSSTIRTVHGKKKFAHAIRTMPPYLGVYNRRIDGRRVQMVWQQGVEIEKFCSAPQLNVCTYSTNIRLIVGTFREGDRKGKQVILKLLSHYAANDQISFKHPDGKQWYLITKKHIVLPGTYMCFSDSFAGETTWQGRQFPLTCERHPNFRSYF